MKGIDNRMLLFVRRKQYRLINPMQNLIAKSSVSPYFGAKDFAFAFV